MYHVDIVSEPKAWWSESTNWIYLHLSVINTGPALRLDDDLTLFSVKQYFAADGVLDGDTPELPLHMPSDHLFDYREDMSVMEIITSPLLTGNLTLFNKDQCLITKRTAGEALIAEQAGGTGDSIKVGKPTIFWKLIATNPENSKFLENDILSHELSPDIFECEKHNVDLGISELEIAGGSTKLYADRINNYTITITQTRSNQGFILASDHDTTDLSYRYDFYLSNKPEFIDDEVVHVDMEYEAHQIHILQDGILGDTAPYIGKIHMLPIFVLLYINFVSNHCLSVLIDRLATMVYLILKYFSNLWR